MRSKLIYILLGCIILLAAFIRLYSIDKVPASPDWDEVALGYNAYSILHTGRDEYGKFMPVVLRSFDDYKPAFYAYLIIPFLLIFDLSVIAVRLPSALFGVIAVGAVFFLIRELFQKEIKMGNLFIKPDHLALLTTFLVAISPWHIQFSRVAFEAQVGLTINILAILFFLKALKNKYFLFVSFFLAAINIYVYQSEKVYTPLIFLSLFIIFFKRFIKIPKKIITASSLFAMLIIFPMIFFIFTNPNALSRAKGVSIFTDSQKLLSKNSEKIIRDNKNNDYLGRALDNRRIEYAKTFISGYISHFNPNWLFIRGDIARHHAPNMGLLYLWTLPFILIGIYILLFSNIDNKTKLFLIGWLFIVPLPASIATDVPHAVRAINFIPLFDLFTATGTLYVLYRVLSIKLKYIILVPIFLVILLNITYYFNQYFVQMNYFDSKYWQYGWKEAVDYTQNESRNFDDVIVSNVAPLDQSYIFYLFYTKYEPKKYQEEGGTKSGGFAKNHTEFGKYIFRPINWEKDKLLKRTIFIGNPWELPDNIDRTFFYLNGDPAIVFSKRYE